MEYIAPHGEFYVRSLDVPGQPLLIKPEPDLRPLEEWIRQQLKRGPKRLSEKGDAIRHSNDGVDPSAIGWSSRCGRGE